jgi:hypothetical protein
MNPFIEFVVSIYFSYDYFFLHCYLIVVICELSSFLFIFFFFYCLLLLFLQRFEVSFPFSSSSDDEGLIGTIFSDIKDKTKSHFYGQVAFYFRLAFELRGEVQCSDLCWVDWYRPKPRVAGKFVVAKEPRSAEGRNIIKTTQVLSKISLIPIDKFTTSKVPLYNRDFRRKKVVEGEDDLNTPNYFVVEIRRTELNQS